MAHEHLTYEDLLRIVELVKASEQFSEFRLKVGEIEIELRRRGAQPAAAPAAATDRDARAAHAGSMSAPTGHAGATPVASPGASSVRSAASAASPAGSDIPSTGQPLSLPEGATVVRSPMVGTFYRSPEPGAAPFVELGRHVEADAIVCIIEVMKLMNSIPAGARGTVAAVLVADGSAVAAGQPLIVLQADAEPE